MEDNHNLLAPASPELGAAQPQLVYLYSWFISYPLKCGKFYGKCKFLMFLYFIITGKDGVGMSNFFPKGKEMK